MPDGEPADVQVPADGETTSTSTVAVVVAAVDEDAMDTTPDAEDDVLLANGSADPLEAAIITPISPIPNGATSDAPSTDAQLPPADPSGVAVSPLRV